mmetsp:Transcript_1714/g.3865  ORF Transcript_1714/g.3865 Transcript_1714/m.3865 type:complete len:113 (-) Transcript_1714:2484-2822(-)
MQLLLVYGVIERHIQSIFLRRHEKCVGNLGSLSRHPTSSLSLFHPQPHHYNHYTAPHHSTNVGVSPSPVLTLRDPIKAQGDAEQTERRSKEGQTAGSRSETQHHDRYSSGST